MQNNSAQQQFVPGILLGALVLTLGLFFSHGLYNQYWLWTLPTSVACIAFAPRFNWRKVELWIPSFFFVLMAASMTRGWGQLGNLQAAEPDREWLVSISQILFLLAAISSAFCLQAISERTKKWLFFTSVALASFSLVFLVSASPRPWIDVWSNQEYATSLLLAGKNPYSTEYLNIYPLELQKILNPFGNSFVYLPGVLYLLAPIKWLGLDTRIALIIALVLTAFLICSLRKKTGERNYFAALLFVSLPFNPYLIDQAWNDTLTAMFLTLCAFALSRKSQKLFLLSLVGMTLIKPHIFIILPLLIFYGSRILRVSVGKTAITWLIFFILGCLPFVIWNVHDFFHSLWGLNAIARGSDQFFPDRIDGFSLLNWFTLTSGLRPRTLFIFVAVITVCAGFFGQLRRSLEPTRHLLAYLAMVLLSVFAVAPLAFINYYQICLVLLICSYALPETEKPLFKTISIDTVAFIASRSFLLFSTPLFRSATTFYKFFAAEKIESLVPIQNFGYRLMPLAKLPMTVAQLLSSFSQANPLLTYRTAFYAAAFTADFVFFIYARRKFARPNFIFYLIVSTLLFDQFFDHVELFAGLLLALSLVSQRKAWITTTLAYLTQWTAGLIAAVAQPAKQLKGIAGVLIATIAIAVFSHFSILDFFVRAIPGTNAESLWNLLPKNFAEGARSEIAFAVIATVGLASYWISKRISAAVLLFTTLIFDPAAGTAALVLSIPVLTLTANLRNRRAVGLLALTCLLRTLEFHEVISSFGASQMALLLAFIATIVDDNSLRENQPPDFRASRAFSR